VWQVTLCYTIWQVTLRSCDMVSHEELYHFDLVVLLRRLIVNNGLREGTQLAYIERAVKEGYQVVVLNTNLNRFPDVSRSNANERRDVPVCF